MLIKATEDFFFSKNQKESVKFVFARARIRFPGSLLLTKSM